ncbi:MAG: DUF1343 domain-containing protein [Calditrichaeota bacterium]|nr:DUF1343 domain-containing protein [Calditrichota bacterium]
MFHKNYLVLLIVIFFMSFVGHSCSQSKVKLGVEVLLTKKIDLVRGKRVGLITNPTGITSDLRSTIDALNENPNVDLLALFGPEHGVRGDHSGGEKIDNYVDEKTGIIVYSLYGKTRKPTPAMLKNVDVLIYDIQDIGSRAYTYIYTMALAMEAARDANIPFIVLDRPDPMGGNLVAGNVLDPKFSSFVGLYPIPYIYGMTVGELAQFFNEEFAIHCHLTVVPMEGWTRGMQWQKTGLSWVPTSPHVPHPETCWFVATTGCIGELGTVSIGVGYTSPFELIGAPWIDSEKLAQELNSQKLPGVFFRPTHFKPYYYLFTKEECSGVQIHILDYQKFQPVKTQVHILTALKKLFPEHDIFDTKRTSSFDRAFGTDAIREKIQNGVSASDVVAPWKKQLADFEKKRKKYLIYQ